MDHHIDMGDGYALIWKSGEKPDPETINNVLTLLAWQHRCRIDLMKLAPDEVLQKEISQRIEGLKRLLDDWGINKKLWE